MCGIAGVISKSRSVPGTFLEVMGERIHHRGPDDWGYLTYDNTNEQEPILSRNIDSITTYSVGFVHRRLSIIDLSESGWQPMASEDKSKFIVYNGEIYNYLEIRLELERMGICFNSTSDTEVLLNAYQMWGVEAFQKFTGMFALAILDKTTNKVIFARDPFGIKPLYYYVDKDNLYFASEIKALVPAMDAVRANNTAVLDYLVYGLTDHNTDTFFHGVKSLPSATYATLDLNAADIELSFKRYWTLSTKTESNLSPIETAEKYRRIFNENIRLHLRSDVKVGACLSGGLDSSSIVATIVESHPNGDLHTFSHIAEEAKIDESIYIDIVNKYTNAIPHKIKPEGKDLIEDMESLIYTQDFPFGSTSIYAQWRIFQNVAQNNIKVMLDGQGADEMLAGYRPYLGPYFAQLLSTGKFKTAVQSMIYISKEQKDVSIKDLVRYTAASITPKALYPLARRLIKKPIFPSWLVKDSLIGYREVTRDDRHGIKNVKNALKEHMANQIFNIGLPSLLRFEDRNSMAFSIESRVPFLTTSLANFIFSLPEKEIIQDGTTKAILRRAMRKTVPDIILDRRDKVGFATSEAQWLTGPMESWTRELLNSDLIRRIPVLDQKEIVKEFERMIDGTVPVTNRLWRWINLAMWTKIYDVQYES